MAKVTRRTPNIISLHFQQERGDSDYGTCLWAVFNFDLDRYELSISSDCGNFAYGWVPTLSSESFMHLMARVDGGYLLDKIAKRSVINTEETFKAVKQLISDYGVGPSELNEHNELTIDLDTIQECCENDIGDEIVLALRNSFQDTPMEDCDPADLWGCICMDYTANAHKIAQVFVDHIRPICKNISDCQDSGVAICEEWC